MAQAPPASIWRPIEGLAPGVYSEFIRAVVAGIGTRRASVSSWWRSPAENRQVGGDPYSQHLLGLGVDLVVEDAQLAVTSLTQFGLVALNEGSHVHVQRFAAGLVAPVVRALGLG